MSFPFGSAGDGLSRLEKVAKLRSVLNSRATGGSCSDNDYDDLRRELLADPTVKNLLPQFVRDCLVLNDFWFFIKKKFAHYDERHEYLLQQFRPLIHYLENDNGAPSDAAVSEGVARSGWEHVRSDWQKALARRQSDPEGAVTAARTLVETTCKHVLDELKVPYDDVKGDLLALYGLTAKNLRLHPSQHDHDALRQILQGCVTSVNGMAAMRNSMSDAHGKSQTRYTPAPRHAELAVNLAGTLASFLVATWEARKAEAAK